MYRLALRLGRANVDAMLREMSAEQLREWMVFSELEPYGEDREDKRIGIVARILANAYRDSKQHSKPYTLAECVVSGGDAFAYEVERRQTWQEMKMLAIMMTTAQGKGN